MLCLVQGVPNSFVPACHFGPVKRLARFVQASVTTLSQTHLLSSGRRSVPIHAASQTVSLFFKCGNIPL
jgi:hypothetical protein